MISVLYVDDEPALLELAQLFLEQSGEFTVGTSTSAREVLAPGSFRSYDAIVADYQMPGLDGIAFLKAVRAQDTDIPFILFTGRGREEVVIEAINNGADFYLQKGGDPKSQFAELSHKIRQAVKRRDAERTLRLNEERLVMAQEIGNTGSWEYNLTAHQIWGSAEGLSIFGFPPVAGYIPIEDIEACILERERSHQALEDLIIKRKEYDIEYHIHPKDGSAPKVIHSVARLLFDARGNPLRVMGVIQDITERKNAEGKIRESEERFRRLAEKAPDMIYRMSLPSGQYEYVSPASVTLTGYTPEEFYAEPGFIRKLIHPAWQEYLRVQTAALLKGDAPPAYEFQIIDRSGKTRWLNQRNMLVTGEHGQLVAIEGIVTDVTRQRETARELQRVQQRSLIVTGNAGSWIWEVDPDGMYRYSSPAVEQILGYRPEELVGTVHFYDLFDPPAREELKKVAFAAFDNREPFRSFINPSRHRNGTLVLLSTSGMPIFDDDGTFSGCCGVSDDITERRQAEIDLRESEAKYRLLADNVHDVIWTADMDMHLTYISPSIMALRGLTAEEALAEPFTEALTPESGQRLSASREQGLALLKKGGGEVPQTLVMDLEFRCKDGSTVWTEVGITPAFDRNRIPVGVVGVTRNITRRRRVEEALRASEEMFRSIVETSPDMIWEIDRQGNFLYMSPTIKTILGYTPEEITGKSIAMLVSEQAKSQNMELLAQMVSSEGTPALIEVKARHRNGSDVILEIRPTRLTGTDGTLRGLRGVAVDITDRKKTEEALRENEEKYRSIVENANEIVFSVNPDGIFTYISPKWTEMLGHETTDVIGRSAACFIHPDDFPKNRELFLQVLREGKKLSGLEYRVRHKNGTWQWHSQSISPVSDAGGRVVSILGICHDITERKKTDEALRLANRQLSLLSSITRHDINNKIMIILGYLGIAKKRFSDPAVEEYLKKIEAATQNIRDQIGFTRLYQDIGHHEPLWTELDTVLPRSQVPATIAMDTDVHGVEVFASPMLEKVFYNLLDNSIRHGERVTEIRVSYRKDGDMLIVTWEDNGVGIATEEKALIFERGFGKNTGLGMFLVREILSITDITIAENGEPGTGARFEIRVPADRFRVGAGE